MKNNIGFAKNLIPLILNGSKTLTYRLGDKYDFLKVEDEIDVRDSSSRKIIGRIKITEKEHAVFKNLPINRKGHEEYKTKRELKRTFEKYYGKVNENDKVIILSFKLI